MFIIRDLVPLIRRSPSRKNDEFEDFYNVLDDFFTSPISRSRNLVNNSFQLDIKDKEDKYIVEADLPGISKEEININLTEGSLTIAVEREEKEETEEKEYVHRERRYTSMSRSVYLGDVKDEDIKAKLVDGVLNIEIPKGEDKERTKRIEIE